MKMSESRIDRTFQQLKYFGWNLQTMFANIFIHRDKRIVVVGAWGGTKFADNSRFLFQFLSNNQKKLELKNVIWVSRNNKLVESLRNFGYEAYSIGSKESRYYHLKAGIHIICNSYDYNTTMKPDIETRYSWGAKKIQLWHGVGFKAVGAASNASRSPKREKRDKWKREHARIFGLTIPGAWNEAYFLCTSKKDAKIHYQTALAPADKFFVSEYPRNCECLKILPEEEKIIKKIKQYSGSIIYLPTFRDDETDYVHPLEYDSVRTLLSDNNWVWIEKPHSADSNTKKFNHKGLNVIELQSDFDINVLYPYVKAVISDYSSAVFDGIYHNLPTIMFTPDLDNFKNGSVGFIFDVETYCRSIINMSEAQLLQGIREIINGNYFTDDRKNLFLKVQKEFFNNRKSDYQEIWKDITSKVGITL